MVGLSYQSYPNKKIVGLSYQYYPNKNMVGLAYQSYPNKNLVGLSYQYFLKKPMVFAKKLSKQKNTRLDPNPTLKMWVFGFTITTSHD